MNSLPKLRFDALAGYSRSPNISLSARELAWFHEADGKLLVCPKNDFTLADLLEDSIDGGAPHERLRVCIVVGQVVLDGRYQFLHAAASLVIVRTVINTKSSTSSG